MMKRSRGFTLLEILTAMIITAILLPVVGVTMYQLLVMPPEQSAHLSITNELQRIAQLLYQDGYRADTFSVGDGNPYYGNFSWTNYSVTPAQQYNVSYKATCPNPSDPSCINHIVRQEDHGNVSTPTPTPTTTPTTYTLTTRCVGNGSITPPYATNDSGTGIAVTATAASGWTFSSWFGDLSGNTSPTTITMNSNKDITAVFTQDVYTLTTSICGSGSISTDAFNPYLSGSVITLTATPDSGQAFSGWSGSITNSSTTTTITMNANKSVTATFTQIYYTLNTSVAAGNGNVTPSSNSYASGSVVQVNATPNTNWAFFNWSGNQTGTTSPVTITMNSNQSVTATFINVTNPRIFTTVGTDIWTGPPGVSSVNVLVVGGGGGGGGSYSGIGKTYWAGGGGGAGGYQTNTSYTVVANTNVSVTVGTGGAGGVAQGADCHGTNGSNSVFGTITANGGGGGGGAGSTAGASVRQGYSGGSGGGEGVQSANESTGGTGNQGKNGGGSWYCNGCAKGAGGGGGNTSAGGTATSATGGSGGSGTANSISGSSVTYAGGGGGAGGTGGGGGSGGGGAGGSALDGTAGTDGLGGGGGGGGGAYLTSRSGAKGGNGTVVVNYSTPTYTLTTSASVGGTVTNNSVNPHAAGSNVTVTATPSSGYTFTGWSGNLSGSTNSTTILMNSNKSVTATFALTTYNLTTSVVGSGTVTPNTSNPQASGSVVQVTANASTGYTFTGWSGNLSGSISPTTITMNSAKSVTATFTRDSYTLTTNVTPVGSGAVFTNTSDPHASGSTVLVTAVPANGWAFSNWSGDLSGTTNITTITMNSNKSGIANFSQNPYTLTIIKVGNGSVAASPVKTTYNYGDVVTLTPTADAGWIFSGFSPASPVTITGATTVTATFLKLATTSTITFLSWHITRDNFSMTENPMYIRVNMTAGVNTSMNKYISKQLVVYIKQRPESLGLGRGGIWGDNAIVGFGSLAISGTFNLFNGDVNVDGAVSVTAAGNRISGTLTCDNLTVSGTPANFSYGALSTPCPTLPNVSMKALSSYFNTNLSTGTQNWSKADIDKEYVFNSSVELTNNLNVYNLSTRQLKEGYYYCAGTMSLTGSAITGKVTFIASKITIENNATGASGNESAYIQLEPYDPQNLLMWATASSGNEIWIKGSDAEWHPCVRLKGILLAPSGEIKLEGTGSNPSGWFLHRASSPAIIRGVIEAKTLTITGHDWWIYRW